MGKHISTAAIVLRVTAFREADVIATLLSDSYGRVDVLARGAKRSKRRFSGGLEPLDYANYEMEQPTAQRSLYLLRGVTQRRFWSHQHTSFMHYTASCLGVEAALLVTPPGEGREIFPLLFGFLESVEHAVGRAEMLLETIRFFTMLLTTLGLDPRHHPRLERTLTVELDHSISRENAGRERIERYHALHSLLDFFESYCSAHLRTREHFLRSLKIS